MKAMILNVGDEVLSGRVVNTNAAYLSSKLETVGISAVKNVTIGDDAKLINSEVQYFLNSDIDILITTGGLGPTHDDFTKEEVAKALNLELVFYEEAKKLLDEYFVGSYTECNIKQTYFPKGSTLIPNRLGTADGCIIEYHDRIIIILVGPPYELIPMFEETVVAYLKTKTNVNLLIKEYTIMGISESEIEPTIIKISNRHPQVNIAPYCSIGKIRFQLTTREENLLELNKCVADFEKTVSEYIISSENKTVEEVLISELEELNYTISFAESCTGGMLVSKLINIPGASNVIKESFVTYSDYAKQKYLDVKPETIEKYNVVSSEVALEMVKGLKKLTSSNINVSVTGLAGPGGGTVERPIGLVHYAININDDYYVEHKVFKGNRNLVISRATMWILYRIYCHLHRK